MQAPMGRGKTASYKRRCRVRSGPCTRQPRRARDLPVQETPMRPTASRLLRGLLPVAAAVAGVLALAWADAPSKATPRAPQPGVSVQVQPLMAIAAPPASGTGETIAIRR